MKKMRKMSLKRRVAFALFSTLSLVWMAVIYSFSAQDSSVSSFVSMMVTSNFVEGPESWESFEEKTEKAPQMPESEEKETAAIQTVPEAEEAEPGVTAQSEEALPVAAEIEEAQNDEQTLSQNDNSDEEKMQTGVDENSIDEKTEEQYTPLSKEELEKHNQHLKFTRANYALRKLAHSLIFAILGVLVYLAAGSYKYLPEKILKPAYISVPLCFVYAVSDEVHQMFVKGRGSSFTDILFDMCGTIVGTFAMVAIFGIVSKLKKRRQEI